MRAMEWALEIEGLRKTYRNRVEALKGIDLRVAAGDFFALLGPNGAGKSTTLGIISSLVRKDAGSVRVFGHDLDRDPYGVRRAMGLVPQEFNFNQFEPVEEIVINQAGFYGVPRGEARDYAGSCLKQLGLWGKRRTEARQLSGGMKRRLMIARALVHRPQLLILDEPTAGVDIEIRHSLWQFLREINEAGTSIILTTHYLEEAESLCRNIAIIDQGVIARQAAMRELLKRLHQERFVLVTNQPLRELPQIEGIDLCQLDEQSLEVALGGEHCLNDLFAALSSCGIQVLSMRNKQNRLEQLFLDMVRNGRQPG